MPLENPLATTIAGLNASWPLASDPKSQGDDHLREIKDVLQKDVWSKAVGIPIDDLSDVDTTTAPPADGDVLIWNETGGNWVPALFPPAPVYPYDIATVVGWEGVPLVAVDLVAGDYATLIAPRGITFTETRGSIEVAPTNNPTQIDIQVNGVSIFDVVPNFSSGAGFFAGTLKAGAAALANDVITFSVGPLIDPTPGQGARVSLIGTAT